MADAIEITKEFPASRERTVLLELLKITQILKQENIDAVVCGGWVPFLKELARHSQTAHSMSLDIDVLLRAKAREREAIDRIKNLLSEPLAFELSKTDAFRYEKKIEGNVVQLDLLADLPRRNEDESLVKIQGTTSSLQLCLADGGEDLGNHVETIQINCREGDSVETFEIAVPDAVGFLILKTTVTRCPAVGRLLRMRLAGRDRQHRARRQRSAETGPPTLPYSQCRPRPSTIHPKQRIRQRESGTETGDDPLVRLRCRAPPDEL